VPQQRPDVPSYLADHGEAYLSDPHDAALRWFRDARYGLFIHYGLYTLLGRGEWVMYHERIRPDEYARLAERFTAEHFDAEAIADLAVFSGMRYITLVTRHHDSFCLFDSKATEFTSVRTASGRDLVAELATACHSRGLGLMLYYSYGIDWRHPYAGSREAYSLARPDYSEPEPTYRFEFDADFRLYIDFMHEQITELLTNYGPIAGIWFDLISAVYFRPDLFPIEETYDLVRRIAPQCLISFKQGVNGTEDYMSQELEFVPLAARLRKAGAPARAIDMSNRVWEANKGKWNEICTIMQDKGWAWNAEASHIGANDVWRMLANAASRRCNLLLNTGPLPDGRIHPGDEATLREVGRRIHNRGFPDASEDAGE
jgi:alpha-L-fucosidase